MTTKLPEDLNATRLSYGSRGKFTIEPWQLPYHGVKLDTDAQVTTEALQKCWFGSSTSGAPSITSTLCCGQKILSGLQDWEHKFWRNLYHTFAWIAYSKYNWNDFGALVYTSIHVYGADVLGGERECHCDECDYCWDYEYGVYESNADTEDWADARLHANENCEGMLFKGIIERSGFGEVEYTEPWYNPNSSNWVRTFTWLVDNKGLRSYYERVHILDVWSRPRKETA